MKQKDEGWERAGYVLELLLDCTALRQAFVSFIKNTL